MGAASLRLGTIASANQPPRPCTVVKGPLVHASLVKRRYTKYLALPSFLTDFHVIYRMMIVGSDQ